MATFWVTIQDNSRITDGFETGYLGWFRFLPREMKLFEAAFLVVLSIYGLFHIKFRSQLRMAAGLSLMVGAASISAISNETISYMAVFQGVFLYLGPFLFYLIAGTTDLRMKHMKFIFFFYTCLVFFNVALACSVQLPLYRAPGDWIYGAFSDAHVFGSFIAIFSLVYFYLYLTKEGVRYLCMSFALLLFSYYPSNEKMMLLNSIGIALFYFAHAINLRAPKRIIFGVAILIALGLCSSRYIAELEAGEEGGVRIGQVLDLGFAEFGPIHAWSMAVSSVSDSTMHFFFGVGPGRYGGIAAARLMLEGGTPSAFSQQEFYQDLVSGENVAGAFMMRTNTWSNLLAEFGLLGFILFFALLFQIVSAVNVTKVHTRFDATMKVFFYLLLVAALYQGLFTPYTNWEQTIIVYPMMTIAAYFSNRSLRHNKVARFSPPT
jgi:hypothetical protein